MAFPMRRSVTQVFNSLRVLALVAIFLLGAEREARAYTDPGTGAMLWQMLAAGFVGLMFYFRRITGWFRKKSVKEGENR
jgi:hypothetical protein